MVLDHIHFRLIFFVPFLKRSPVAIAMEMSYQVAPILTEIRMMDPMTVKFPCRPTGLLLIPALAVMLMPAGGAAAEPVPPPNRLQYAGKSCQSDDVRVEMIKKINDLFRDMIGNVEGVEPKLVEYLERERTNANRAKNYRRLARLESHDSYAAFQFREDADRLETALRRLWACRGDAGLA